MKLPTIAGGLLLAALSLMAAPVGMLAQDVQDAPKPVASAKVADDAPVVESAESLIAKALEAHKLVQATRSEWTAKIKEASDATKAATTDEEKKAANAAVQRVRAESNKAVQEPTVAFQKAFAATDYRVWDAAKNEAAYVDGMASLITSLTNDHDTAKQAVEACQFLAATLPESAAATRVVTTTLPNALSAAHMFAEGAELFSKKLATATEVEMPGMLRMIGDYQAAGGNYVAASASYAKGLGMIPETLEKSDPRARAKSDLTLRAVVGQPAHDYQILHWMGGVPKSQAALKGKVVMLDFWATWCPPCRAAMPGLNKLYLEKKDEGLVALGITRQYGNGYTPKNVETTYTGGAPWRASFDMNKPDQAEQSWFEFVNHVQEFRDKTELAYPFVISDAEIFKDYKISGIPSIFIVNHEGIVTFAMSGANHALIAGATEAALVSKKAADEIAAKAKEEKAKEAAAKAANASAPAKPAGTTTAGE